MAIAAPSQTELDIDETISFLKEKYPDAVSEDTREGYGGVVVDKSKLVDIALTIRDELGFDYLGVCVERGLIIHIVLEQVHQYVEHVFFHGHLLCVSPAIQAAS